MNRFSQRILAYFIGIPLAVGLGYLVATPDMTNIATVGFVVFCLSLPLIIQWHHKLVIIFWNSAFVLGFLPGQPRSWLVLALLGFGIAWVNRVLGLKSFLSVPEVNRPLALISLTVAATAVIRGGLGLRVFGSAEYGSKSYIYVLASVLGYFALTSERISLQDSQRAANWFFLSSVSYALGNLVYALGPAFYFLFAVIPPDFIGSQVASGWDPNIVNRLGGLGPAGAGLLCFAMARWGLRGSLQWEKPWRYGCLLLALACGLFCGFRAELILIMSLLVVQFFVEGLWKTALLPVVLLAIACALPLLLVSEKLPRAVQRSLAFLPISISSDVKEETVSSTEWRLQMWGDILSQIPKYLIVGKGYVIDPGELYLTTEAVRSGLLPSYAAFEVGGDFHSGPLSVLIPFGIFGCIGFVWLIFAGIKVLYLNYRYGDARLKKINSLLLTYYMTQALCFIFVFGAMSGQLYIFTGLLGFSVSLNHGVCRKAAPRAVLAPSAALLEPA